MFGNVCSQPARERCCLHRVRLAVMGESSSSTAGLCFHLFFLPQIPAPGTLRSAGAAGAGRPGDGASVASASLQRAEASPLPLLCSFRRASGISTKQRVAPTSRASSSLPFAAFTGRWASKPFRTAGMPLGCPWELASRRGLAFLPGSTGSAAQAGALSCVFDVYSVFSSESVESGHGPGQPALVMLLKQGVGAVTSRGPFRPQPLGSLWFWNCENKPKRTGLGWVGFLGAESTGQAYRHFSSASSLAPGFQGSESSHLVQHPMGCVRSAVRSLVAPPLPQC